MTLEELVRLAWNSGCYGAHDTKTSATLKKELEEFMEDYKDEIELLKQTL